MDADKAALDRIKAEITYMDGVAWQHGPFSTQDVAAVVRLAEKGEEYRTILLKWVRAYGNSDSLPEGPYEAGQFAAFLLATEALGIELPRPTAT